MPPTITRAVAETYDSNVTDNSGGFNLLGLAIGGDVEAARNFAPRPLTFMCEFLSTLADDPTLIANAVMNLTTLGVLFPAGTMRNIRIRCWSKRTAATNAGYVERLIAVQGAAPPTLPLVATADATISTDGRTLAYIPNGGTAGAPEYGFPVLSLDGGTGGLFIAVRNNLAAGTAAAAANTRWRVEVLVDALVTIPVSP